MRIHQLLSRREPEPIVTREELNGLIGIVMGIDETTQDIRWLLREEDDGEEEAEQDQ